MGCCSSAHKKELEQQVFELQEQMTDDRTELRRFREKEVELTSQLTTRSDRVNVLEALVANLEASVAGERATLAAHRAQAVATLTAHADELREAEERVAHTLDELAATRESEKGLQSRLGEALADLQSAEAAVAKSRTDGAGVRRGLSDRLAHQTAKVESLTKKMSLLRMTNQKIVEKLSALKERNKELSEMVAAGVNKHRRFILRCSSRDEADRLVRYVCVDTTPNHELIRYRRFASALLRALVATEPEDAADENPPTPPRRRSNRRRSRRRARPAAIADEGDTDAAQATDTASHVDSADGSEDETSGDWFSSWFD